MAGNTSMVNAADTSAHLGHPNSALPAPPLCRLPTSLEELNRVEEERPSQDEFFGLFQDRNFFDVLDADYPDLLENLQSMQNVPSSVPEAFSMEDFEQGQGMSHSNYQRLLAEFPDIVNNHLSDRFSLLQLFHLGLEYLDNCSPFFHRPTLKLSMLPPLLILAVCSLGGCRSVEPGAYDTGKLLHRHVRRNVLASVIDAPRVDVSTLQTMVVIEHVGFYTLSRLDHELADVMHAMTVTSFSDAIGHGQTIEIRWKTWADRETLIRLAHSILVYDRGYSIHFMHPSLLSTEMIKLPLPCSPPLWQATTAREWEERMKQARQPSRVRNMRSLQVSMELLLPICSDSSHHGRRSVLEDFSSNPFTLQILIHGVASAVFEENFRTVNSASSRAKRHLSLRDFDEALTRWLTCFDHMTSDYRTSEMARSALVTYHFVAIMLHENLSNIMMAAGAAYSSGHAVTSQRAQEAFVVLTTTKPVGHDSYRHALEIVGLCLVEKSDALSDTSSRPRSPPLFYVTYTAFIGILVLWAYALGLSRVRSARKHQHFLSRMMDSGKVVLTNRKRRDSTYNGGLNRNFSNNSEDEHALKHILDREFGNPDMEPPELKTTKSEVRQLMCIVRDRLTSESWEISQEARRMLESLLEKSDFRE